MSRKDDIERLITSHTRRLQKLKERQAIEGLTVDPKIPIEIEDIETEIEGLRKELETLEKEPPINNPFHYGGPVPPEGFVGHRRAVDFCQVKLTAPQPTNIAINGERRSGKTSFLHYLRKYSPQEAWGQHMCLFLDLGVLSGTLTATNFWQEILRLLQTTLTSASSVAHQLFELLSRTDLTGQDFRQFLDDYYRPQTGQSIILLLDEFELIFQSYNQEIKTLLINLRAITQDPTNKITLITATRDSLSQVCQPFTQETGLEFHSHFVPCQLEPFDEPETHYVVQTLLSRSKVEFTAQELTYIWQLSQWKKGGAHPFFVQMAASLIFDYKQNNQTPLDYYHLARKFEALANSYRAELPQDSVDYEQGLNTLEQHLPLDDSVLTLKFYALADRLHKIIRLEPKHRLDQTAQSDLQAIIKELTHLSRKVIGLSFEELSIGRQPD